jgi:hypothetical protein
MQVMPQLLMIIRRLIRRRLLNRSCLMIVPPSCTLFASRFIVTSTDVLQFDRIIHELLDPHQDEKD